MGAVGRSALGGSKAGRGRTSQQPTFFPQAVHACGFLFGRAYWFEARALARKHNAVHLTTNRPHIVEPTLARPGLSLPGERVAAEKTS